MITIMEWKGVEMIDGKFYFVDVARWIDNEPNEWVFMYKENSDYVTKHYCAARINQVDNNMGSIYNYGHVCGESSILYLRPATQEDMGCFYKYLQRWNYRFNVNTKKLRHVGRG